MKTEFELRYYPINKNEIRNRLLEVGFQLKSEEYFIQRKVYQISSGKWLRVRNHTNYVEVTLKNVEDSTTIDGTREINVNIPAQGFKDMCNLFDNIFPQSCYQESLREEWFLNDTMITIDTWPGLDPLVEIEALTAEDVYVAATLLQLKDNFLGDIPQIYEKIYGITLEEFHKIKNLSFDNIERDQSKNI